jgi:hypothetical protein
VRFRDLNWMQLEAYLRGDDRIVLPVCPDLVEAYVRDRRVDMARQALDELEAMARATDRRWALAAAARCRGLLTADAESAFAEAASLHSTIAAPFESARATSSATANGSGDRVDAERPETSYAKRLRPLNGSAPPMGPGGTPRA